MLNIFYRNLKDERLIKLDEFKTGAWVNLADPSEEEIEQAVDMLGVDKSLLTDALDEYEMPRLEIEDKIIYIYTRVPDKNSDIVSTIPLLIVIGNNFTLTISKTTCHALAGFFNGKVGFYTTQKTKLFLQILFSINRSYEKYLFDLNKSLRSMKFRLEKIKNKDIIKFIDLEQVFNDFLSALTPLTPILQKILTGKYFKLYEEDEDLIEDIMLGSNQLMESAKSYLRYTVNLRDAYSNIMTHDLNRIMKKLTALTIIMTVPNAIFGFFGMNVIIPGNTAAYTYLLIITSTIALIFGLLFLFKRQSWL